MSNFYYMIYPAILWEFIAMTNTDYFAAFRARLSELVEINSKAKDKSERVKYSGKQMLFVLWDMAYGFWALAGILTAQWPFFIGINILVMIFSQKKGAKGVVDAVLTILLLCGMLYNLHFSAWNFGGILPYFLD